MCDAKPKNAPRKAQKKLLSRKAQPLPSDADWLAVAARLASRGRPLSRPNPAVGTIIVKNGAVVGRGWTQSGGRPHGEAMALSQAGDDARGATLYSTLEPCAHRSHRGPACSDIIAKAGVARVVYGVEDPDERTNGHGANKLRWAGVAAELLDCPHSHASLKGYLRQKLAGRPYVTLKLAMSLDGFIARPDGESQWITGKAARAHVHSRRALSDAILVGSRTWRVDKPRLDVRLTGLEDRSPLRIVLSQSKSGSDATYIHTPQNIFALEDIQYLYVEGGAKTAASFLEAGLVDRIEIYRAPILLGSGIPALGDYGLASLADAHGNWQLAERRMLGSDTYEAYEQAA